MKFIPRDLASRLKFKMTVFPCVLVLGPRQCGKSTLVKNLFPKWTHLDLEKADDFDILAGDIEGFFLEHPRGVVIDEAQRLPELFTALRPILDGDPAKGRLILLGSASPLLMRGVSESLVGRSGSLEMTPFRVAELAGRNIFLETWFWGGYPPVQALRGAARKRAWIQDYISHFLSRDLPALGLRISSRRLRLLWTMLTHVHGQILNVSDLANSLGSSARAIGDGLDVLEGAFLIRRLQPFFANVKKRLVKRPKAYIRDTGLLHQLAGLREPRDLASWPGRGRSFEGLVIEELAQLAESKEESPELYYWRTQAGAEVDLLIKRGRKILPVEIKAGATVNAYELRGLRQCMQDLGLKRGLVICQAHESRRIGGGIEIWAWQDVQDRKLKL